MLEIGCDIELKNCEGMTSLLYAACSKRSASEPCLQFFMQNGANILAVDDDAMGPLHLVALLLDELCDERRHLEEDEEGDEIDYELDDCLSS